VFSISLDREGDETIRAGDLVQDALMLIPRIGGRTTPDLDLGWAPAGGGH
jgi:hypothetical protein